MEIDGSELVGKTALNIYFNPEKVFSIKECGDNAWEIIDGLKCGMIPFDFDMVAVSSKGEVKEIAEYVRLNRKPIVTDKLHAVDG